MRNIVAVLTLTLASAAIADELWVVGVDDDDSSVHTLSQVSVDAIPDEYATKEVQPTLQFRCAWGETTFRIDWGRFISSFNTEVGFRVDGGKATWLKLSVDPSNKMTIGNTGNTRKLIAAIGDGELLNVEVAPYSEPSVFVNYDVATFTAALDELEAACG